MSTAAAQFSPEELAHLEEGKRRLARLEVARKADPLSFATCVPWQEPLWHLAACDGIWRSEWGPRPSRVPRLIVVVAANRTGKSTIQGRISAAHARGKLPRFRKPGEIWGAMPTLADSVAVMRPHVARWLGPSHARWTPREGNTPGESLCRTGEGWILRLKAYEQGREHFQGGKLQAATCDEQCPDDVLSEIRARLIDLEGVLLATFTPLLGTDSQLFGEAYEPWQSYKLKHPQAKWGEVTPGVWVFSVGMRDNAVSNQGFLPDAEIDAFEAQLIAAGKYLEAQVRVYGAWLDIASDPLLPHEMLRTWSEIPRGGWGATAAWIDPAYSANNASCETGVGLASLGYDGGIYLRESIGEKWQPHEKAQKCAELLISWGCPPTYVQRVGGDTEFAAACNNELMRMGGRACISAWPDTGHVPDKVTRCQDFAPLITSGQVRIRPEHFKFRSQAAKASVDYIKARGPIDCLDAGMGACMRVVESPAHASFVAETERVLAPPPPQPFINELSRPERVPLERAEFNPWSEVE